ncbi:MAG: hypothetical protein KBT06_09570 [Prevotellaceae bacterium]|nr:hypothetical protein [Candidatus Colivivens equi]
MGVIAILMFLAFSLLRVSLRLPWAMNRLAFQAASGEGSCTTPRVSLRLSWAMNRLAFQAASGARCEGGRQKSNSPKM